MSLLVETEREDDGRWIAEIPDLPGVMAYGATREAAIDAARAPALRVLADLVEHGEEVGISGARETGRAERKDHEHGNFR